MATIKELSRIFALLDDIGDGVTDGSLTPAATEQALRSIIDGGRLATRHRAAPAWWRNPARQLTRACRLWKSR